MRQSTLFTKTRKEAPADEVSVNAKLLIKGGYIHKELAGAYAYLPLGRRVMRNITQIIREEMTAIGGQEVSLTALQDKQTWEQTGRWSDDVSDVWFKTNLKSGGELGLGWTHEEPITQLMTQHIHSYKDLPKYVFQIQTKFRNELRAKSGILRGREFLMKDLYSFSTDEEQHNAFHEKAAEAYHKIFERCGIGEKTYFTLSPGGSFSEYSHEFQTVTSAGEDNIHICEDCEVAINEEIIEEQEYTCFQCGTGDLKEEKAVEIGDIYSLHTKFSEPMGLTYADENGEENLVFMGCYGIGVGRLMGTIVEVHNDEDGIIWPESVAPFSVHLVNIGRDETERKVADTLHEDLTDAGIEVLYDDREETSIGEKFADSDLLGMPTRVIISSRNLENDQVEIVDRATGEETFVDLNKVVDHLS